MSDEVPKKDDGREAGRRDKDAGEAAGGGGGVSQEGAVLQGETCGQSGAPPQEAPALSGAFVQEHLQVHTQSH